MERVFDSSESELMDRPQPVSDELETTLLELEFLNRYFGGHGLLRRFLARWFKPGEQADVLDLATGGGDFPRAMVEWGQQKGVDLRVEAVDAHPSILRIARSMSANFPEITYTQANALTFDPDEGKYNLVHCSLALHHFSEADAVALLSKCKALATRFVLVSDLERSWFTRSAVHTANAVFRHGRMTCEDGDTSARRAFSFQEAQVLAERAGWQDFGHRRFLFCRQALWIEPRK